MGFFSSQFKCAASDRAVSVSARTRLGAALLLFLLAFGSFLLAGCSTVAPRGAGSVAPDVLAFLERLDAAQVLLQNGDATAYKAMWSHGDHVTISGGFGGTIEKGWPAVERRLEWAATQFSRGRNEIERVEVRAARDLGYVVQIERIRFVVPGQTIESTRVYRVTMVFAREAAGWRLIHRHADVQTTQQPVRNSTTSQH